MGLDMRIIEFVHGSMQSSLLDKVMPFVSRLGNGGLIWIGIAVLLMAGRRYRQAGFMVICALMLGAVMGELLLKNIFQRMRPFVNAPHFQLLIRTPLTRYSFPSGHTTSSFAAAGIIFRTVDSKLIKGFVLFVACSIAFSRLYLLVHYPTDILGGIGLGLLSSYIVYRWFLHGAKNRGAKTR